jgi:FLVCR family MFS transporter
MCCGGAGDGSGGSGSSAGLLDAAAKEGVLEEVCQHTPYSLSRVYWACIGGGFCLNAVVPLFYELSMETTWPIAEGSVCGFLVLTSGTLQSIFLFVPIGNDTQWMNWTLAATFPVCLLLLLPFSEKYPRLERDQQSA